MQVEKERLQQLEKELRAKLKTFKASPKKTTKGISALPPKNVSPDSPVKGAKTTEGISATEPKNISPDNPMKSAKTTKGISATQRETISPDSPVKDAKKNLYADEKNKENGTFISNEEEKENIQNSESEKSASETSVPSFDALFQDTLRLEKIRMAQVC